MRRHRLAVLPDLAAGVYAELVESIKRDGLHDAIWLHEGEVLDGWHRLSACGDAGVEPRFREYAGASPATFVLSQQRARRSLSPSQAAAVAATLEADLAEEARGRAEEGRRKGRRTMAENRRESSRQKFDGTTEAVRPIARDHKREASGRSDARAAATVGGTNRQYVASYKRIKREDPTLAAKVRNGTVEIPGAVRLLRQRKASARKLAEAAAKVAAPAREPELHLADFRDVAIPEGSVDAVITDPPYERKYLDLYSDLAAYAARVLKPGGVVAAMSGHIYLPEIHSMMGEHLTYVWTLSCNMRGASALVRERRAAVGWKPIVLYAKGGYDGPTYFDRIESGDDREHVKEYHEWGQSEDPFLALVERFTRPGDLVLDPFLGGGTTGVAAVSMKRRFVGVEELPEKFEAARRRMADAGPNARAA